MNAKETKIATAMSRLDKMAKTQSVVYGFNETECHLLS